MKNFIPYEKLSKKQKKAYDNSKRVRWGMSPVTRKLEPPGAYNRTMTRRKTRDESGFAF